MGIKKSVLTTAIGAMIITGCPDSSGNNSDTNKDIFEHTKSEIIHKTPLVYLQDMVNNQTFLCLNTDSEDSYTHKNVLEAVSDPENTVLEYPISQLFQKYGNSKKSHPLYVSGVSKTFKSLLGSNGLEEVSSNIDQKLNSRKAPISSGTAYEIGDTLRFSLIDHRLKGIFPQELSQQLQEEGFQSFSNADSLYVTEENNNLYDWSFEKQSNDTYNWWPKDQDDDKDYVYDIVVKSIPGGKSALAVYRNGKLFMATYVSIGTIGRKTLTGQFKIKRREPYKRSQKYDNAAMPFGLNISGGYYFHQGNVTGTPLSHGCIRLPGVYASVLYSLTENEENVDVFIDKNLYKLK